MKKFIYILFILNCGGITSQKAYCEERATYYFTLCIANLNIAPGYLNKPTWNDPKIQEYARNYCVLEYLRKNRCKDKGSLPRRDEK